MSSWPALGLFFIAVTIFVISYLVQEGAGEKGLPRNFEKMLVSVRYVSSKDFSNFWK